MYPLAVLPPKLTTSSIVASMVACTDGLPTVLTRPGFFVSALAPGLNVCLAQYSFKLSGIRCFRAIFLKMCSIPLSFDVARARPLRWEYPTFSSFYAVPDVEHSVG
jgi:hypothetical protein